jgi:hypothetical protein
MGWKMWSVAKRRATSAFPAVARWTATMRRATSAAVSTATMPSRSCAFHTGCPSGARNSMAKERLSASSASTRGTSSGTMAAAVRIHATSQRLRSTGASHTALTLSCGRARFTQIGSPRRSTR